jgi:DNA-binding beta-propeller fold protein YncE
MRFGSVLIAVGMIAAGGSGGLDPSRAQTSSFKLVKDWARVPPGFQWGTLADSDFDAEGNLWVLRRRPTGGAPAGWAPLLMFDRSLTLVKSLGAGAFDTEHGLHIDFEGNVWVADSGPFNATRKSPRGSQVFKFSRDGKLLMTIGKPGVVVSGPDTFVAPTDVFVNARGEIFISEGHMTEPDAPGGNRIVKLARDGTFIKSWGRYGSQPGEFRAPHRLAMDSRGRLFVADRGNQRIQIFDQEGNFIDQWKQFRTPSGLYIDLKSDLLYVAVAGTNGGIQIGSARDGTVIASIPASPDPTGSLPYGMGPESVSADAQGTVYAGIVAGMTLERYVKQ